MIPPLQFFKRRCYCFPYFPDGEEYAFKQSLQSQIVYPLVFCCMLMLLRGVLHMTSIGWGSADPLRQYLGILNLCLLSFHTAMILLVASRKWIARCLCPVDLELCAIVTAIVVLTGNGFCNIWDAALLFGRDPYEAFADWNTEGLVFEKYAVFLRISSVTTACSLVPVRAHLSWLLPIGGVCVAGLIALLTEWPHPILIFYTITLSGAIWLSGYRYQMHLRKEWLAERHVEQQKEISEKQRQGFFHLLNRLCDCLLQLGPGLEILEPCPNLAAMLFHLEINSFKGSCFCDLLASAEDRDNFVAAMARDNPEAESSGILPLHLRATQNREIQVHAYYTTFYGKDGSPYHIVGIVEAARTFGDAMEDPDLQSDTFAADGADATDAIDRTVRAESETGRTLESLASSDLGQVSITFKDSPPFNIVSCTPGYTSLCGPIGEDTHFLNWIDNKHEFVKHVQHVANYFASMPQFEGLVLKPPDASCAETEFVVRECTVDAVADSGHFDDVFGGRYIFQMSFCGVQQRKRGQARAP